MTNMISSSPSSGVVGIRRIPILFILLCSSGSITGVSGSVHSTVTNNAAIVSSSTTTIRRTQMIGTRIFGIGRGGGSWPINSNDEDNGGIFDKIKTAFKRKPKVEPQSPEELIKHQPTAEQTNGIDPFFVRVCAQVSADVYHQEPRHISRFDKLATISIENTVLKEPPKAVIYDSNSPFTDTNPPFVAVVAGNKLILSWRGTGSYMDCVRDVSIYLGSSSCWKNVAKVVKVHAGSLAAVENSLVAHEAELLKIIDDYEIKEILVTGHSLAGGIAQVALLWFQGTMDITIDPTPNKWKELATNGLTVKCMSFQGLSTTVYAESDDQELNQKGIDFINKCGANMCTTAFSLDPVPMVPGHFSTFGMDFIEDVLATLVRKKTYFGDTVETWITNVVERFGTEQLKGIAKSYFPISDKYQHIGNVLYYASPDAEPKVYIDNKNGILVGKEGFADLSEIKYKNQKDALTAVGYNHRIIVRGPGLAFYRNADVSM
eukprot:CAMPEP_0198258992 /NCGR_PEP_ID=MMETSP1447-20131203/8278_1 /TAXON_ID=420782 /ORGANISM="Chaetoceros dichaeta, Strain CCMP1751" /LENGTH=488 /DNA_ID=CAMNT_0043946265 /DNA_START=246 /DNA_END=1712 /DNA_ORIENTATION=-